MPHEQNIDEQSLARQAVDNADAFQELYHRYFGRVYGFVASRIDNMHDAEDVVSDIFLRAIRNLDQFRNRQPASFAAWLFVIARHTITDYYRRDRKAEQHVAFDEAEPLAAVEPELDSVMSRREEAARLRALVNELPERTREIVTLRYYGGLRNTEIAEVLGIGEKTVAATISRALDGLQAKYVMPSSEHDAKGNG